MLRLPVTHPGHLFASLPGSTRSSSVRVSQLALPEGRRAFRARVVVQPATRSAGLLARGRERDLPGFQAIHPVPLPRSTTPAEPTTPRLFDGLVGAAPAFPTARASALSEFRGSITRLQHLLSTLQERCCHRHMQDSLPAGWLAFTGWELNPLVRDERFPSCYISSPLSLIYPDARRTRARRHARCGRDDDQRGARFRARIIAPQTCIR